MYRFIYEDFISTYDLLVDPAARRSSDDKENKVALTPRSARQRRRTLLPSAELNLSQDELISGGGLKGHTTPGILYGWFKELQAVKERKLSKFFSRMFVMEKNKDLFASLE